MEELINSIKDRILHGQYQSETAVREAIVLPVLRDLGWDVFDPAVVIREYNLSGRRVDYALCAVPPRKSLFIEVKAVGQLLGGDRQLFEYAFHEGIPFAVLTDGREWSFFLPGEQGSYDERRVQKLDVVERSTADIATTLRRYLELSRVTSGEAISAARSDYQSLSRRKDAASNIPKAWLELVNEPDDLLVDLIAEKVEALCGYRPAPEDVEAFLINDLRRPEPQHPSPQRPVSKPAPAPVSERGVSYTVFGQHRSASNAIDALIDILRSLASRTPGFFSTLAPQIRGRSRNHVASSRFDVYPRKPDLVEYTVELVPGWWLGTNIANRDKMRIIRKACEVAGLSFGRDISISLPNAS